MKVIAKKTACLLIALTMIGSLIGCSKKTEKKTENILATAEDVTAALISRNSKKVKKTGEFSEETLQSLDALKDNEAVSAVMDKATFEVDKDSVKESKKGTSVKVNVTLPDYEAALEEADGDLDAFVDAISEQKEKEYKTSDITLKFEVEDDNCTLTNGDDAAESLYKDIVSAVEDAFGSAKPTEPPTTPNSDPTDSTPTTDTAPTDSSTDTQPTDAPTDTTQGSISSTDYDVVIYKDDKIIVHFGKVANDGVHFNVENLTDIEIDIQIHSLSINGIGIPEMVMSDKVDPKSTGEVVAKCKVPGDGKVGTISGELRVVDFSYSFDTYPAHFDTTVIDSAVTVTAPAASGPELYADDKVKIYYKEVTKDGVVFQFENLTNMDIEVEPNSVAVNGVNYYDVAFYGNDLSPMSLTDILVKCSVENGLSAGTVSAQFELEDQADSFDEYRATIDTTVVDSSVSVTAPAAEGVSVYEDDNVKIYCKGMTDKGVLLEVENLSAKDLIVQAESFAVNGRSIYDVFLSIHTAPHSYCQVVAKGDLDAGTKIGTVGGAIIVADKDNSKGNYYAIIDNAVVDASVKVEAKAEGTLVYEDAKVKIYYKEVREKGIVFDVENLTGIDICFQARGLILNDEEVKVSMSDDIAPHSVGEIIMKGTPSSSAPVTKVTGDIAIISWDRTFDTYHAEFTDVAVG